MASTHLVQLILDACRPDQSPADWHLAFEQSGADWHDLAVHAIVLGLAPQLHARFSAWALEVPARPAAKLAVTFEAHARRNAQMADQLGEVLQACAVQGLHPIVLKGMHLAFTYYETPALRPMNDIDLLFTPAEMPAAEAVLQSLGYAGRYKSADLGPGITKHTSTFQRPGAGGATPNPYLSTEAARMVEPHLSLEESWFGLKVDITPGVRERAVLEELAGYPCRVLSPADLLLHVAVHFCFHLIMGAPAMVQLTDLLVVSRSGRVDWQAFQQRAVAQRAAPFALAALKLAQSLLGAPVPAPVLADLAQATPAHIRQRIDRMDLTYILQRTQQKPLTTIPQRIRRGIADRFEAARWATGWQEWWQIWQTAVRVDRTDTGRMLGRALRSGD